MHRVAIGSNKIAVSAVDHVRDVSLFEAFAKLRTLTIAERVIQDDGRRNLIFHGNEPHWLMTAPLLPAHPRL